MANQVKLAIVGCGGMSAEHIRAIEQLPDAQVAALVDIRPQAYQQKHKDMLKSDPSIRTYDSLDEMLKSAPKDLRGVVIVTPHTLHFEQSVACLEHGYDVLVEKPMVTRPISRAALSARSMFCDRPDVEMARNASPRRPNPRN